MRALNFFNGWIFIRLKDGNSRHNQYYVSVVARTKKRALELLREYSPSTTSHFMDGYFSRVDSPPTGVTATEECILIRPHEPGPYVRLEPSMKLSSL